MKKTRVSEILGIEYPIIQGGMLWLADAGLAGAVSNTGALGIISPLANMERRGDPSANLKEQISRVRELTKRPFGVNIPLDLAYSGVLIDALLREEVGIVVTAAGDPSHYTELLLQSGAKVFHVISSVRQAVVAEGSGVHGLIAEGAEAAGHLGLDELPLFSLIPQVVDAVSVPVVAAGGIADERGFVAAMALGAEGVQLGTRFVAVEENIASEKYKQAIVEAEDRGTMVTSRRLLPTRSLKTAFTGRLRELDESGASPERIREFLGYGRAREGQLEGDLVEGEAYCGASAGLIREVTSAAGVVRTMVEGHDAVIRRLIEGRFFSRPPHR